CDDTDHAVFTLDGHRPAIGLEREDADLNFMASLAGFIRRQADSDNFRIGEADGRDAALVPDLIAAGNDLRHHLALRHGAMGQHRLTGHVAESVDAAHGGAAALVNPDETPIHIQPDFAQAPAIGLRLAAYRNKYPVCLDGFRGSIGGQDFQPGLIL